MTFYKDEESIQETNRGSLYQTVTNAAQALKNFFRISKGENRVSKTTYSDSDTDTD